MAEKPPYNPNNLTERPLSYYGDLFKAADPDEIGARTGVKREGSTFILTVLGEDRPITWPDFPEAENWTEKDRILLLRYLLEGKMASPYRDFAAYADLPWGSVYDASFKGRCIRRMVGTFGTRPEAFCKACENAGGVPFSSSGIGYEFRFMPNLFVRFILWEGDEEFPPSGQIVFSDNFPDAFSGEDRVVVCEYILKRLK